MFKTKKTLIRKLYIADIILESTKAYNSYLCTKIDEYFEEIKKLKRDLDIESRKKEELAKLLAEAERDVHCPADCKNRKNQDVCRLCTRYPAATDRYEVES